MVQSLDNILGNLHSDRNRFDFLMAIYSPGNIEVIDRILPIPTEISFLEKNLADVLEDAFAHSRARTWDEKVRLGKVIIDYYMHHNDDCRAKEFAIKSNNPDVAQHAMQRLSSLPFVGIAESKLSQAIAGPEKRPPFSGIYHGRLEESLGYAADIARAFGKENEARLLLERQLELHSGGYKAGSERPTILAKLGRHDEAIDLAVKMGAKSPYLNGAYISTALTVAKEHVPHRLAEIARVGFSRYARDIGLSGVYFECAKILEQTEKARATLLWQTGFKEATRGPSFYQGLVMSLAELGEREAARSVVEKVAAGYRFQNARILEDPDVLATMYHLVGDVEQSIAIFMNTINEHLRLNLRPESTKALINTAFAVTDDMRFREKELALLENQKDYRKAAALARELGKTDLAETYEAIPRMLLESLQRKYIN